MPALGNLPSEMSKKGFETVDLLSACAKPDGSAMNLADLMPPEFDLREELLSARVKVLTKTDRLAPQDKKAATKTSCFYNWPSKQMIGNYENWVFAQPVEDWCLVSYKSLCESLGNLMCMFPVNENRNDPLSTGASLSTVLRGFGIV